MAFERFWKMFVTCIVNGIILLILLYFYTLLFLLFLSSINFVFQYSLQTTIFVPRTTIYKIYAAYTMTSSVSLFLTLRLQKGAMVLSQGALPTATVTRCNAECFAVFFANGTSEFRLEAGTWNVMISSSLFESTLKIVSIVNHLKQFVEY